VESSEEKRNLGKKSPGDTISFAASDRAARASMRTINQAAVFLILKVIVKLLNKGKFNVQRSMFNVQKGLSLRGVFHPKQSQAFAINS
jgi:hypothetical protein